MAKSGLGGLLDSLGEWLFGDIFKSISGSGLTSSEIQQNEFNAEQAQLNRDWQEQMDNTKVQRSVQDMQAAGVNPAMMLGGSAGVTASTPSGGVASGSGGRAGNVSLDSIMNMAMIGQRFKESNANIQVAKAEASRIKADSERIEKENTWIDELRQTDIDEARSRIDKNIQEAQTEESKRANYAADTLLKNATAEQIQVLLPYETAFREAQTDAARAAAARDAVHAAYEQGLIDSGYIKAMVRQLNASASLDEQDALASQIENIVRTGNDPDGLVYDKDSKVAKFFGNVMAGLRIVKDALPGSFTVGKSRVTNINNSSTNTNYGGFYKKKVK